MFEKLWREALKRNLEMLVTPEEFRFRRWMRWISIDRVLPHRFALVVHDLARQERDQHELETLKAQKQGKIVQPRRYYQDSYHLCYELLGQRNDITEICGRPEAQAVLTRLRAIDDDQRPRKGGDGAAIAPRSGSKPAGAIPPSLRASDGSRQHAARGKDASPSLDRETGAPRLTPGECNAMPSSKSKRSKLPGQPGELEGQEDRARRDKRRKKLATG